MCKGRVLHVVGGMDIGGTETMLMNLYRKVNTNIQFDFISYYENEGYYDEEIRRLGGNVIRLSSPKKIGYLKAIKELKKAIKENGPYDVVHSHTLFYCGISNIAAKLCGVKVRISHAHTTLDNSNSLIKKIYIFLMRIIIRMFSTDFLCCSNSAGKYLFGNHIVNNKKYRVIPNYIDYEAFLNCKDDNTIKKELGLEKNERLIVHIGRFIDAKNHKFLVQIINNMHKKDENLKAIFVGDGILKPSIKNLVNSLNLENTIKFLGVRTDIKEILNNSDLLLFPSIYEGLGLVILEAQAAGLPCIVSEAIQPEADLQIGLLKYVNLDEGIDKWCSEALNNINNKRKDKLEIEKAFKDKGYEINDIVSSLLEIYKLKLGE